jgi:hypothetical protein
MPYPIIDAWANPVINLEVSGVARPLPVYLFGVWKLGRASIDILIFLAV